ncbi:hypothetical protein N7532_004036 [Penicillium argentinense]|uniref:Extracellular membrane protein CFEM domain-containing protein n=1 Tax=Penicillium argentinense TaxID=1131581 RepID=A0A9W9FP43_9EURO|nr:uncharacterized protein N7532_004036 [Penicillium argentinense]KAJ5103507.1 hypothetical protein N7532_004036 [Penicillium argentinense]
MRSFIAASLFVAGVTAQTTSSFLDCATAALDGIDASKFKDCTGLTSQECFCNNKDAVETLSEAAEDICKEAGVDLSSLDTSLCSSNRQAAPARHASQPMMPANMKRAYSPDSPAPAMPAEPRVIYVTETRTECACKSTPTNSMHISQIPVDVPASSSMGGMLAASSPAVSNGVLVGASSSSAIFGSQASAATPTPSGADPNRFHAFQGAAPQVRAVYSGVAAFGVAAVMGMMIAL